MSSKSNSRNGFTMIELLVAMAVMAVLVVLLFGMVDAATKLWKDNENRVDAYREARAALAVLSSDLRTMLVSKNQNFFSTNISGDNPFNAPNGLFFLTSLSAGAQASGNRGDLCAVGYYRAWQRQTVMSVDNTNNDTLSKSGFHLFRTMYESDRTYTNLNTSMPKPLDNLAGASPEVLARNVCTLEFLLYETNGTGTFKPWTYRVDAPVPQLIEIRLGTLSEEAAKKLGGSSNRWNTNDPFVQKNLKTFTSRVHIPREIQP